MEPDPPRRKKRWCVCTAIVTVCILAAVIATIVDHGHAGYSEHRAAKYAALAGAAYCPSDDLRAWNCGPHCIPGVSSVQICEGSTTKAFVAKWDRRYLLSFEGTHEYMAMVTDLEFYESGTLWDECKDCRVHAGFLSEWQSLRPCILRSLADIGCSKGSELLVTGHSLGAALAGLGAFSLSNRGFRIGEIYTFGMPRAGDANFAKSFDHLFGDRFFRVTHHKDPIPQVPPAHLIIDWHFNHVEPEVFYDGDVEDGYVKCSKDGDAHCSEQYYNLADDIYNVGDHLRYMDLVLGVSGCGSGALASSDKGSARNASMVI